MENYNFRKLILLGDVFESLDFRKLSPDSWNFLNYVGRISRDKTVRWVIGNHDQDLTNIYETLIHAKIHETYVWQYKEEKYLAIHGHQFDRFLVDNAFLSYLASRFYNLIQKFDYTDKRISHFLKRQSKGWLRLSEKVANSALRYAKKNGANYIFCGHTHKAMEKKNCHAHYFNSGCWTDTPCTFITIDEKDIQIHEYN